MPQAPRAQVNSPLAGQPTISKVSLIATTILSLISLVPGTRFICGMTQKVINYFSSLSTCSTRLQDQAIAIAGIGLAILGIVAIALASPILFVISYLLEATLQIGRGLAAVKEGKIKEALFHFALAVTSILSAAGMLSGCFPVTIAATGLGLVISLYMSAKSLREGRYVEAICYLTLAGCQAYNFGASIQKQVEYDRQKAAVLELRRKWAEILAERLKVQKEGGLHEKWNFQSDHLPIGAVVNGRIRILSWNVLASSTRDSLSYPNMGLDGSLISKEDIPIHGDLTIRDAHIADKIVGMDFDVLALQEASPEFLADLRSKLPSNYQILPAHETPSNGRYQIAMVYDANKLSINSSSSPLDAFPSTPNRPLQDISFTDHEQQSFRLIHSHVPGDPKGPGLEEFANYIHRYDNATQQVISLGDMNFSPSKMQPLLGDKFFVQTGSYQTHAGSHPEALDWFTSNQPLDVTAPEEILPELPQLIDLLHDGPKREEALT